MPKWKGFGYAYTRWRPGMGFVLCFIVLVTALMHYVVMKMNYARDSKKVEYFTEAALRQARGANRKVRVPFIEGGVQSLELVVEDGWVYLVSHPAVSHVGLVRAAGPQGVCSTECSFSPFPLS